MTRNDLSAKEWTRLTTIAAELVLDNKADDDLRIAALQQVLKVDMDAKRTKAFIEQALTKGDYRAVASAKAIIENRQNSFDHLDALHALAKRKKDVAGLYAALTIVPLETREQALKDDKLTGRAIELIRQGLADQQAKSVAKAAAKRLVEQGVELPEALRQGIE